MDEKRSFPSRQVSNVFTLPALSDLLQRSSDADGFKREIAVRRLGVLGNPASIPLVQQSKSLQWQGRRAGSPASSSHALRIAGPEPGRHST
jgi:hypothetical protein